MAEEEEEGEECVRSGGEKKVWEKRMKKGCGKRGGEKEYTSTSTINTNTRRGAQFYNHNQPTNQQGEKDRQTNNEISTNPSKSRYKLVVQKKIKRSETHTWSIIKVTE